MPITIDPMTAKEKLLEQAPNWSEEQAQRALLAAEDESEQIIAEDRSVRNATPEALRRFDSGRDQPDWAKVIRRSRLAH